MVVSTFIEKTGGDTYPCGCLCSHLLFMHTQSHSTAETQAIFINILQLIHSFIKESAGDC